MALARHNFTVQDAEGNLVPQVLVTVRSEEVGTPLAVLWQDRDGLVSLGNPVLLNQGPDGLFFHVEGGAYSLELTTPEGTILRRYVAVGLAQEIDNGALALGNDASDVPFSPTGNIAATNVQAAAAELDTEKQVAGSYLTQGLHTIWVPASAMIPRTSLGPAPGTTLFGNGVQISTLDFDQSTQEFAYIQIAMPKSWDEGQVRFVPYWTAAAGSGDVVWLIHALAFSDDNALDQSFSASTSSVDTLLATGDMHIGPTSNPLTIDSFPLENDLIVFRVMRNATSGSDTLSADAKLLGIKILFSVNAGNDA